LAAVRAEIVDRTRVNKKSFADFPAGFFFGNRLLDAALGFVSKESFAQKLNFAR